jgi:hypothetical protein
MEYAAAYMLPLGGAPWEKEENPCANVLTTDAYISPDPRRHQLGYVGGNEVSRIKGNQTDVESDLRGITRINTRAPWRDYQPTPQGGMIKRENWKTSVKIDTTPQHLREFQAHAYPAVYAPKPLVVETCREPHKY